MRHPEPIIEAIRIAFAGVSRGSTTVHEAEEIDTYGSDEYLAAARRKDTETRWEDVPDRSIAECTCALSHLDPESWRYYIPAYMIWSLKHYRSSTSTVPDFTIYSFDPQSGTELEDYKAERFRLLTVDQSRAVCRFLRYLAADEDHADATVANKVLDNYWGQFCQSDEA